VIAGASAPVPLIADGDNGHGGPLNVARLTRAYEQAGAACIQLEDQVFPKRCGHMEDKEVVSRTEAVAKIRAAVDARSSSDFKIMARTDARATHGLDEALRRGEGFLEAGADILFIEAAFAGADAALARERAHLTTTAAGVIAREANVRRVEPFHFSPRYAGEQERILAEVMTAFQGSHA
jgi:2-methylisocitrate lyase-like PEP mutase family enzyme